MGPEFHQKVMRLCKARHMTVALSKSRSDSPDLLSLSDDCVGQEFWELKFTEIKVAKAEKLWICRSNRTWGWS